MRVRSSSKCAGTVSSVFCSQSLRTKIRSIRLCHIGASILRWASTVRRSWLIRNLIIAASIFMRGLSPSPRSDNTHFHVFVCSMVLDSS